VGGDDWIHYKRVWWVRFLASISLACWKKKKNVQKKEIGNVVFLVSNGLVLLDPQETEAAGQMERLPSMWLFLRTSQRGWLRSSAGPLTLFGSPPWVLMVPKKNGQDNEDDHSNQDVQLIACVLHRKTANVSGSVHAKQHHHHCCGLDDLTTSLTCCSSSKPPPTGQSTPI
jgi:hypothetical protein